MKEKMKNRSGVGQKLSYLNDELVLLCAFMFFTVGMSPSEMFPCACVWSPTPRLDLGIFTV